MRGRTVILIAHMMSTIVNDDTIVVVENGRVAHTGTHYELLDKSTFYSNVCSMQNIDKEAENKVAREPELRSTAPDLLKHPFVTGELDDLQPLNHAARKF
uniref:Uncharacterized protein n=1 Tax=Zea mays TaxID=4577 RepID=A0A804LXB8_MAIZE